MGGAFGRLIEIVGQAGHLGGRGPHLVGDHADRRFELVGHAVDQLMARPAFGVDVDGDGEVHVHHHRLAEGTEQLAAGLLVAALHQAAGEVLVDPLDQGGQQEVVAAEIPGRRETDAIMRLADPCHRLEVGFVEARFGHQLPMLHLRRLGVSHVVGRSEEALGLGELGDVLVEGVDAVRQDLRDVGSMFAEGCGDAVVDAMKTEALMHFGGGIGGCRHACSLVQ